MQVMINGGDVSPIYRSFHVPGSSSDARRSDRPTKKRTKLRAALAARAVTELGDGATALDYVCDWVASGRMITELAVVLAGDMGESCSRSFLSLIIHRLAPDATARIADARMLGADALLEQALEIIDAPDLKAEQVPLAKARVNGLLWHASRLNRAAYGAGAVSKQAPSLGALHLDALRQRNAQSLQE